MMKLTLVSEGKVAIGWAIRVIARLMRVSSRTTVLTLACSTTVRITRLLTFLLPLKVILLAGSNGMPSAFRTFLAEDQRQEGIIILSLVAILSYIVTLFLENRSKRLSEKGSQQLLAHSGVMAILNIPLTGFLIALIVCFFLMTAWLMERTSASRLFLLQKKITKDTGAYLNLLSSIAFLTSFLIIIYPFILGYESNVLVALVSFILMRQLLSAFVDSVKNILVLFSQRHLIDTLLFSERVMTPVEGRGEQATRNLFTRREREQTLAEELADLVEPGDKIRIDPLDASVRQALEFTITLTNETMSSRVLRQRVFPPQIQSRLRNEDLLFELVDRDAIGAPPLVRRYFHGEHECVITDVGLGDNPRAQDWSQVRLSHLETVWALEPPAALASIYAASHSYLHQRLTDALISRMEFALTSQSGEEILTDFVHRLPQFRDRIARLPLCLVNRDQSRERMLSKADGGYYQLDWCDWCLEPAGFGLGKDLQDDNQLSELILHVGKRRPSFSHSRVSLADLQLTKCCADLEQLIIRGKLVAGLALASEILEKFSEKTRSGLSAV